MAWTEKYVSSLAGGGGDGSSGSPWTLAECTSNLAAGERGNVKDDGSYSSPGAFSNSGTRGQPLSLRGYTSTIGDGGRPTIGSLVNWSPGGGYVDLEDLILTGNTSAQLASMNPTTNLKRVKAVNSGTGATIRYGGTAVESYFESAGGGCWDTAYTGPAALVACFVKSGGAETDALLSLNNYGFSAVNSIFVGNGSCPGVKFDDAIAYYAKWFVVGCTFYNVDDGVDFTGLASDNSNVVVADCLFHTVGGDVFAGADAYEGVVTLINNAAYSVTGSRLSGCTTIEEVDPVACSVDPLTNASGGDFSRNSTAGGGALLAGAGIVAPTS